MLPWKAPNDHKTIPMGILYDYMSCWTTLEPFRYKRGPKNGAKQHKNGPKSPEWLTMALYDPKWPLNTSHGYIIWLYVMLDHPRAIQVPTGAPKWPKTALKWPKMAQNHQNGSKWHCMTPNDPKHFPWVHNMNICHIGPPWTLFRGLRGP